MRLGLRRQRAPPGLAAQLAAQRLAHGGKKPVENQDLWQDLLAAEEPHEITWELVKGHAGHELNERADVLAVLARERAALGRGP